MAVALTGVIGSAEAAYITATKSGKDASAAVIESRLKNLKGIDVRSGVIVEQAPQDLCKGWVLSDNPSGTRKVSHPIQFKPPFSAQPEVILSLTMLDSSNSDRSRLLIYPSNINTDGFEIVIQTWGASKVCGVQIQWYAFQH